MNQKYSTGNKKISKGFTIALLIFLLSILNTFFYLQYSQNNISPFLVIWMGIVFSFSVFAAIYSFANSSNESESKNKQLYQTIKELENRLQYLFEITLSSQEEDVNKLYEKILAVGTGSLNLEIGLITKIEGNTYSVLSSIGEDKFQGKEKILEFAKTCCGITFYANEIVLLDNIQGSIFQNHPCSTNYKIKAYVGASLIVDKKKFGTVNFFSLNPKTAPLSDADKKFIQLMAKIASLAVEHRNWMEKLKANNEELEWLNKIKIGRELRMIELKREIAELKKQIVKD